MFSYHTCYSTHSRLLCVDVCSLRKGCTLNQFYHFRKTVNTIYENWKAAQILPITLLKHAGKTLAGL